MKASSFIRYIDKVQLLTDQQIAEVSDCLATKEPHSVLRQLVQTDVLTAYQANRVWFRKTNELVLGQYRILDQIGSGSFGQVFKAMHTFMKRLVAVKIIRQDLVKDKHTRRMFFREMLALTELKHDNIVMAYDANELDNQLFLVMEYVAGRNLEAIVCEQGPLPVALGVAMMREAACALQYAHEKGIIHRDIKPDNLLVPNKSLELLKSAHDSESALSRQSRSSRALIKITDFGLARIHDRREIGSLFSADSQDFVGTPTYTAPEQANNSHDVDIRTDLYSLGCTFYYALTGRDAFEADTVLQLLYKHVNEDAGPIQQVRPEIPDQLAAIIQRLMQKDRNARYQTPAELLRALEEVNEGSNPAGLTNDFHANSILPGNSEVIDDLATAGVFSRTANDPARDSQQDKETIELKLLKVGAPIQEPKKENNANLLIEDAPLQTDCSLSSTGTADPIPETTPQELDENREQKAKPVTTQPPIPETLAQLWLQWVKVIENASHQRQDYQVDETVYRNLYEQLLNCCRAEAEETQGKSQELFHRMDALVSPWVSCQFLLITDEPTRLSLLSHCKQLTAELGVTPKKRTGWLWFLILAISGLAALVAFWVVDITR